MRTKNYRPLVRLLAACENTEKFVLGKQMVKSKFDTMTSELWNTLGKVIDYGKENEKSVFGDEEVITELIRIKNDFKTAFRF